MSLPATPLPPTPPHPRGEVYTAITGYPAGRCCTGGVVTQSDITGYNVITGYTTHHPPPVMKCTLP